MAITMRGTGNNSVANSAFIINMSGDTVAELQAEPDRHIWIIGFVDGVARVEVGTSGTSSGGGLSNRVEVYYIDTNGNRLF